MSGRRVFKRLHEEKHEAERPVLVINSDEVHYWKIAPGKQAVLWDQCMAESFICMGWGSHNSQGWTFAKVIKPNDRIVANKGKSLVLGIGTVTGPCHYDPTERPYFTKGCFLIPVKWDDTRPRRIVKEESWFRTLRKLTPAKFKEIVEILPPLPDDGGTPPELPAPPFIDGGVFGGTPEQNRLVEQNAIKHVTAKYEQDGWKVKSIEKENRGYDLFCTRKGQEAHVEVKGTSGDTPTFIITANEVRAAREDTAFRLCVVLNARTKNRICREFTGRQFQSQFGLTPLQFMANIVS